jgi:hypothetical protein
LAGDDVLKWARTENPLGAALGVAFVIFLIVVGARSLPPSQAPQVEAQQQPRAGLEQRDPTQPAAQPPASAPARPQAVSPPADGTEFWPPILGYRLRITDTLIAGFMALLLLTMLLLWRATRRLARRADDTAERQLRAYVCVESAVIKPEDDGFRVVVSVQNTGVTPAYKLQQRTQVAIREYPLLKIPLPELIPRPGQDTLAPQGVTTPMPRFGRLLTKDEEREIRAEAKAIYVYGELDYTDVFGKSRVTKFRFRCNGHGLDLRLFMGDDGGNEST